MRKLTQYKLLIILILIFFVSANLFADTYSTTITAKTWSAYGDQTLSSVVWTASASGGAYWGYDANKGQQFGSASSPATALSLTTAGISGIITDIKVTTSGASSIVGNVGISVGGTTFTTGGASTATLTSTSTTYDFTSSGSGTVVISWAQTSSKALYLKSIEITYTTCNSSNLSFASSSVSKIIGDAAFTQTATSLNTAAITYSSSATDIATVNSTSGEVTLVGIGSTTITANQASGNGYCAASASYTLTVTAAPTLTVTDVSDITLNAFINNPVTQIINISADNLSTNLGLSITGTDAALFSLSQYSIGLNGGSVPVTPITVTYSPTVIGNHTATLTMASTGAMNLTRTLTGVSTNITNIITVQKPFNVYVINGNIAITADSGETLDIYNAIGQRLVHKLAVEGLNPIAVSAHGMVIVKVGNRFAKVIL
jgi:hypothetical protein